MSRTIAIKVFLSLVLSTLTTSCIGLSTWIVARNLWCKRGGTFKTLSQAQAACLTLGSHGSQCHGVYDARCDGRGESHVCKISSVSMPNSGGCVYMPTSVSSPAFKPRTSTELKSAVRAYSQASPTDTVLCQAAAAKRRIPAAVGWEVPMKEDGVRVVQLPTLHDNYVYLLQGKSGQTAVIDPSDGPAVIEAFRKLGWAPPSYVLNTHHHYDHTGGNLEVKEFGGPDCRIIGPAAEAASIPGLDIAVKEHDIMEICETKMIVMATPGHTSGHVSFHAWEWSALFCGDTLFALGCGRLFEGTAAQMYSSLGKFSPLPDDTLVLCGHEYTQSNAEFCLTVEPDNPELKQRSSDIDAIRARGEPTVPSLLGEERRTNCFLRSDTKDLKDALGLTEDTPGVDVLTKVRLRKDNF